MQFSDDDLDAFIKAYRQSYKKKITKDEAREMAFRLMTLYDVVLRKLPEAKDSTPPDDVPPQLPAE